MREFELVLPAYNEAQNLSALLEHAAAAAKQAGHTPENFQVVLVNNGSTDETEFVLQSLSTSELGRWFRVVNVRVNQGYGYGLWQGLKNTNAKYVGWSHADLQCDPSNAFLALSRVKASGPTPLLVKGKREGRNWKDRVVTHVFESVAFLLLGLREKEINAQPKVFPSPLLKDLTQPPKTFAFDVYVLYHAARAGYQIETISVKFPPRIHGVSKWASNFLSRYKTILGMIRYMWSLRRNEGRL
jgi:glycosyltransferase involved in cell wall biosynthesis